MAYYTLTEQDIERAKDIIPIVRKTELIREIAQRCVLPLKIAFDDNMAIPDRYMENTLAKSLFLRGLLVMEYLQQPIDGIAPKEANDYMLNAEIYDKWGNILNQLERLRRNAPTELQNKIFDLMADYRDTEKRLNAEIYGLLAAHNDVCSRLCAMITMQTTPEAVAKGLEDLKATQAELEKLSAKGGKKAGATNG